MLSVAIVFSNSYVGCEGIIMIIVCFVSTIKCFY